MQKQMKCLVSWVTQDPKLRPTTQCQVGLYFLSNSFLMQAAISFSMLNFSRATLAQSIASCCISSFMSACLMTAFLSADDIVQDNCTTSPLLAVHQYQPQYSVELTPAPSSLQIQRPIMKQQLQRILDSDISHYKLAVTDRITSFKQIEQTLTERSEFLQSFQEMLRRQMQGSTISVANAKSQVAFKTDRSLFQDSLVNKQNLYSTNRGQNRRSAQLLNFVKKQEDSYAQLRRDVQLLKKDIMNEVEYAKKGILSDFGVCAMDIIEKVSSLYETKIEQLQEEISRLNKKIEEDKIQSAANLAKYQMEGSSFLQQINNYYYKNSVQTQPENNQQSISMPVSLSCSRVDCQPSYICNQYLYEKSCQPAQMTIKNSNSATWKHYVCDISGGSSEHHAQTDKKLKDIRFQEYQGKRLSFGSQDDEDLVSASQLRQKEKEPTFPFLLKNNVLTRSYDVPAVRPIAVSFPPIDEGFSTLKMGNDVVYRGMWKYKKFHGKGKLTLLDYTYEGQFKHGLLDGRGCLKIGNIEFMGQFRQNKAHGEGRLKIGNKSISGKWRENTMQQIY